MTDKHTPGPWKFIERNPAPAPGFAYVIKHDPRQPSDVAWPVALSCCPADARLIAAAPELLKALEAFLNGDPSVSHMKVTYENACLAVAHAKGDA